MSPSSRSRLCIQLWAVAAAVLTYESFALNHDPTLSILFTLRAHGFLARDFALDPAAGGRISLLLGWSGFGLMALASLYVLRKRVPALKSLGSMAAWLDFHIFCGMAGPLLILFHTNFRIGGMAAVAFWAMMISFGSGLAGRYFYLQVARQKTDLERDAEAAEGALDRFAEIYPAWLAEGRLKELRYGVLSLAGAASAWSSPVLRSMIGDLRLRLRFRVIAGWVPQPVRRAMRPHLFRLAVTRRRIRDLEAFRKILGYWHAFHAPFAIVMYATAIAHIAASLFFMTRG